MGALRSLPRARRRAALATASSATASASRPLSGPPWPRTAETARWRQVMAAAAVVQLGKTGACVERAPGVACALGRGVIVSALSLSPCADPMDRLVHGVWRAHHVTITGGQRIAT